MVLRQDLLNLVKNTQGFARPNRFKVVMAPPTQLLQNLGMTSQDLNDSITLTAKNAQIPGWALESVERTNAGEVPDKMASTLQFNDTSLQFYVSKDHFEIEFFNAWKELIVDQESNRLGYHDDYVGMFQVIPTRSNLQESGLKVFQYTDVFPKTVSDIELAWDAENQVSVLNVAFAYKNFTIESSSE